MSEIVRMRECEGFYEKLADCIERSLQSGEILAELMKAFPKAKRPESTAVNTWLRSREVWRKFIELYSFERTEVLWNRQQARLRSLSGIRYVPMSLRVFLKIESEEDSPKGPDALLKRYG